MSAELPTRLSAIAFTSDIIGLTKSFTEQQWVCLMTAIAGLGILRNGSLS